MTVPPDPLDGIGIAGFGERLRSGKISSEAVTAAYFERAAALDPHLGAYTHLAHERALASAQAADRMVAAGVDLGPLMGLPVAVKDLFTVTGMPTTAGSSVDISDLVKPEGHFVKVLKRAGCVILGKTRTNEFAVSMINIRHRQCWNPWDAATQRMPGGSSSGSAVAMAARMCAFSVGTDTGGSVRQPAALNGVFGFKASPGRWAMDGVFPLSTTLDSLGIFTASAGDAALVFAALGGGDMTSPRGARGLVLGRPTGRYVEELDSAVKHCVTEALSIAARAGACVEDVDVPEAIESDDAFTRMVPAEMLATLGRDRFLAEQDRLDPVARARGHGGLDVPATDYIAFLRRHAALRRIIGERMRGCDGWVSATTPDLPLPVHGARTLDAALAWNRRATRNTRPGNLFGQCGVSLPVHRLGSPLPVGLQIMGSEGGDAELLAVACAVEGLVGRPQPPDVAQFVAAKVSSREKVRSARNR